LHTQAPVAPHISGADDVLGRALLTTSSAQWTSWNLRCGYSTGHPSARHPLARHPDGLKIIAVLAVTFTMMTGWFSFRTRRDHA
jgi:hypothetical protein